MTQELARQGRVWIMNGAGEQVRTVDIHVGNVMLYQLSYTRILFESKNFISSLVYCSIRDLKFFF